MGDPFAPLENTDNSGSASRQQNHDWIPVAPVPADAPAAPEKHPKLGMPTAKWTYRDAGGVLLGFVLRFDGKDGKVFRPLVLHRRGEKREWR